MTDEYLLPNDITFEEIINSLTNNQLKDILVRNNIIDEKEVLNRKTLKEYVIPILENDEVSRAKAIEIYERVITNKQAIESLIPGDIIPIEVKYPTSWEAIPLAMGATLYIPKNGKQIIVAARIIKISDDLQNIDVEIIDDLTILFIINNTRNI